MSKPNYNNSESYPDPTAYAALVNIERETKEKHPYRPIVYVCSPLAGNVEANIENTRHYCRFAIEQGTIPFAPHLLYPQILNDDLPEQRKLGLFFGLVWLGKCQEMWVFGSRISEGMALEIAKAKQLKRLKIRYFDEECTERREAANDTKPTAQYPTG